MHLKNKLKIKILLALIFGGLVWRPTAEGAGITNPNTIIPEPSLSLPAPKVPYTDPAFGTQIVRLLDAQAGGYSYAVPIYAQLQSWNANGTRILLALSNHYYILDATTYAILDEVWTISAPRWSPVDPDVLYYLETSSATLMKYVLSTKQKVVVRAFPEYTRFYNDKSQEALSNDGKYIAFIAYTPTGGSAVFSYNIQDNIKGTPYELNVGFWGDRAQMSPLGNYVLVQWGRGLPRQYGMEAFDRNMNYVGKVHTGSGHADVAVDNNNVEWLIIDNADNANLFTDAHYLVKARIPDGFTNNATYKLLRLEWDGINNFGARHISCRNIFDRGWCVVSGYAGQDQVNWGWAPFRDEIFKLYIDSTDVTPHVERLAHHHSQPIPYTTDNCPSSGSYWAHPHANPKPDGKQIIFGSNWRRVCPDPPLVDPYILKLVPGGGGSAAPNAPTGLRVN